MTFPTLPRYYEEGLQCGIGKPFDSGNGEDMEPRSAITFQSLSYPITKWARLYNNSRHSLSARCYAQI